MKIAEILQDYHVGDLQSVGIMEVVPILKNDDEENDSRIHNDVNSDTNRNPEVEGFSIPDESISIHNTDYGNITITNDSETPTIIPHGSGWNTTQYAQDHAIGKGVLVAAQTKRTITNAYCIQDSQSGTISPTKEPLMILPLSLRNQAMLGITNSTYADYSDLWNSIHKFNRIVNIKGTQGHVVSFIKQYDHQMNQFVAEFELLTNQVGAIILLDGHIIGVELLPSSKYFASLWNPLIRVCYGGYAIAYSFNQFNQRSQQTSSSSITQSMQPIHLTFPSTVTINEPLAFLQVPTQRTTLTVEGNTLKDVVNAWKQRKIQEQQWVANIIHTLGGFTVKMVNHSQCQHQGKVINMNTVTATHDGNPANKIIGEAVRVDDTVRYLSLNAPVT